MVGTRNTIISKIYAISGKKHFDAKKGGNLIYCGLGNNVNSLAHITEKSEKGFR